MARRQALPIALALLSACRATATADVAPLRTWGTLREVLHDGHAEGRVSLADALQPHSVGIGIGEGLMSEIVAADGRAWIGHAEGEAGWSVGDGAMRGRGAAFLALADVARWRAIEVRRDVAANELEAWLEGFGREQQLGETWPFVIQGRFAALEAHVLRGACPRADANAPEPVRCPWTSAAGRLVGFFARDGGGVLTHHGEFTHVHVVLDPPTEFVGHVDAVAVCAGSTLRIPAR